MIDLVSPIASPRGLCAFRPLHGLIALTAGCAASGLQPTTHGGNSSQQESPGPAEIRARALGVFEYADLFKPQAEDEAGRHFELAPLILQQRSGRETSLDATAAPPHPDVLVMTSTAFLYGQEFDQITYGWTYRECQRGLFGLIACYKWPRGIRLTLDRRGFPLVYEVLDGAAADRIYVSRSLENAAADEYGRPLPGENSSLARAARERARATVVLVLEDGPVPMGPIVYVAGSNRTITSVICRCMPSQVNNIVRTDYYRLIPPDALESTQKVTRDAEWTDPTRLERVLRWPHGL